MGRHAGGAGHLRAGFARDQRVETTRQLAFRFGREAGIEPFGDQQPQDAVAQKFQPLVIFRLGAAMGQRLFKGGGVDRRAFSSNSFRDVS